MSGGALQNTRRIVTNRDRGVCVWGFVKIGQISVT